jgi:hypothetical protein
MPVHDFTLVVAGLDPESEELADALFEAGCDDATFGSVDSVGYGDFHREAPTAAEAIDSAIRAVESVVGLGVLRVEPDDLVTLSEIAERLGRTRESVRLLVAGERGPGDFPPPASHLRSRNRLWRWSEVALWAARADPEAAAEAQVVAAINAALELRHRLGGLSAKNRSVVSALTRVPAPRNRPRQA